MTDKYDTQIESPGFFSWPEISGGPVEMAGGWTGPARPEPNVSGPWPAGPWSYGGWPGPARKQSGIGPNGPARGPKFGPARAPP